MIDLMEKAELSIIFFAKQTYLITNNSKLPTSPSYLTDKLLSRITFSAKDVGNKGHHDNLSIRMLKLCGDAICEPSP